MRDLKIRCCVWSFGVSAVLAALAAPALAHDSWFERLPGASAQPLLLLGTGNQFPVLESGIGAEYLVQQGCQGAAGAAPQAAAPIAPLTAVRNAKAALVMRAPASSHSCWVQLTPFDVTLEADKVALYLDEMNASTALRATWAAMHARGLRWQERYTKHARIALTPDGAGAATAPPAGVLGMDALLQRREGGLTFTVLRDGQPLPGLAVELRSAAPAVGSWHQTDGQGQIRVPPLAPGRWLLRAIDLRPSSTHADRWESRFLTLAFEVGSGMAAVDSAGSLQR